MAEQCCKYDYDHDGNCHIHRVDKAGGTRMPRVGADKVYDVTIEQAGATYRVWVDFGNTKGYDVAFTKWGAARAARKMIRKHQKESKVTRLRMTSEGEIIKKDLEQ